MFVAKSLPRPSPESRRDGMCPPTHAVPTGLKKVYVRSSYYKHAAPTELFKEVFDLLIIEKACLHFSAKEIKLVESSMTVSRKSRGISK
jgi:hypothetical protein